MNQAENYLDLLHKDKTCRRKCFDYFRVHAKAKMEKIAAQQGIDCTYAEFVQALVSHADPSRKYGEVDHFMTKKFLLE